MDRNQELIRTTITSLAELLERILDKGIVIAGDIRIDLVDIELLTIRIRLLIASVDKAKEMGINWWERDPFLTTTQIDQIKSENYKLKEKVLDLEKQIKGKGGEQIGRPTNRSRTEAASNTK